MSYPSLARKTNTAGDADLLARLLSEIEIVLGPLLPAGSSTAVIDFPNYANVGDSAIWLGQKEYLRRNYNRVVYSCDRETYSKRHLEAKIHEDTVILLQGGGNFGDIYPWHQRIRETVIADFPNHRIIVLPQTIRFNDDENLKRAQKCFNAHENLTILLRDSRSLDLAASKFKAKCLLCPDMAFMLGALKRSTSPTEKLVPLLRKDPESQGLPLSSLDAFPDALDWMQETESFSNLHNIFTGRLESIRPWWQSLYFPKDKTYDFFAALRLKRGCRILSQGQAVVTDRLHGHILCLMLGIPHVLLDNSYGKISTFYNTWTRKSKLTHWAESLSEAQAIAESL